MEKCKICNKEFKNIAALVKHVFLTHKLMSKEYCEKYLKKDNDGYCIICGKQTKYSALKYSKYCGRRCSMLGKNKGKKKTEQQRKNISIGTKKAMYEEKNREKYFIGFNKWLSEYKITSETRKKRSLSLKGKNKGRKHSDISKKNMKDAQNRPDVKKRKSEIQKIIQNKPEVIAKKSKSMKLTMVRKILNGWGYCPGVNLNTIPIFQEFKKKNNLKNCYFAGNPKELRISGTKLYSLDFIDFDKKLIIEVDEKHHFKKDGNLRDCDIQRQREIQEKYPDFRFLRFKDFEMHKILEIKIGEIKCV